MATTSAEAAPRNGLSLSTETMRQLQVLMSGLLAAQEARMDLRLESLQALLEKRGQFVDATLSERGASEVVQPERCEASPSDSESEFESNAPNIFTELAERRSALYSATYVEEEQADSLAHRRSSRRSSGGSWLETWMSERISSVILPSPRNSALAYRCRSMRRILQIVVNSQAFDMFSGFMVIVSSALAGVETEHLARYSEASPSINALQQALNVWYIIELILKLVAEGAGFFWKEDWHWNMLDLLLVLTSIMDLVLESVSLGEFQVGRVLRVIRVLRMARTLRLVRLLRYLREFRKMVYALAASAQTLFWSWVLLLTVIYTFAICITQGVIGFREDMGPQDKQLRPQLYHDLDAHFGSLPVSLYTLYQCITTGINWGKVARPLFHMAGGVYVAVFVIFISISYFGVLNIVTSVFVESAMQSSQHSRDLLVQEKMKQRELYVNHLKNIFREIDTDKSGCITEEELTEFLANKDLALQSYFEALDVNASDAHVLFRLLDSDNSGSIDYHEFCEGCLHLKGEASSFDINCLIHENKRMQKWQTKFMVHVEAQLKRLSSQSRRTQRAVDGLGEGRKVTWRSVQHGASVRSCDGSVPRLLGSRTDVKVGSV